MSLNAPLDRSSDKSSDSGGLLSLSSLALSEGEGSWLLAMKGNLSMRRCGCVMQNIQCIYHVQLQI